ncbi:hypothetical protein Gocc_1424 [Gaiella occulta]|uniref:Major facilitator superfamily (MFS) profile domain-containing protein n=1 Tax=Gaiella occulta TaxID=1002870 RepID=A0A7M2YX06_9ACTN|nr:MFS transporter [Gaiella occulta]RDI74535.1 hypothetical protein Gocc_1424 [Gaiella occulta]
MQTGPEARGIARYRMLFEHPHVPALLGWGIVARLPLGMTALTLILVVRAGGAGYGEAGLVAAAYSLAVAVGAPYAGRRVDRRGAAPVLRLRLVAFPALLCLVALGGELDAPVVLVSLAAAAAGLALPPVSSALRSIWPRVLGDDAVRTAYALEAALQEVIFVGGPLLVAVLAVVSPLLAVLGAAAATLVGTLMFVRLPPVRAAGPAEEHHGSRLGALSSPGVRTIALLALFLGLAFGSVEIAAPAFAELEGNRALAGLALAGFAAGSLAGGLAAGLRPSSDDRRRLLVGAAVLVAALVLPLLAGSLATLTALFFVAGVPIAPIVGSAYGLIGRVAAPGSVAEAFAWFGTAVSTGFAGGSVAGGWLVDQHGWRSSVLLGVGFAGAGAAFLAARRATLAGTARPVR